MFHLNCTGTCSEPQGHTEINSSVAYSFIKIIPYSLPYSTQCTRGTGNPSTVIINNPISHQYHRSPAGHQPTAIHANAVIIDAPKPGSPAPN